MTAYPPGDPNTAPPPLPQPYPQYPQYPAYPPQVWAYAPPAPALGRAPSLWPVIVITLFSGLIGLLSASRRARRARLMGHPTAKYWGAFAGTFAGGLVLWTLVAIVAAVAAYHPVMTAPRLAQDVVREGHFTDGAGTTVAVAVASCRAADVAHDGSGMYACDLEFTNGARQSFAVTVFRDGRWTTDD